MKIGILTFHLPTNFGANLQAFASSRYFASLGHEVCVLNYARHEDLNNVRNTCEVQQRAHRVFVEKRLPLTRQVTTVEGLKNLVKEESIDLLVIGADAVWRKPKDGNVYFAEWLFSTDELSSIPVASMSPAHMGNGFKDLSEEERVSLAGCLEKFSYISVRDTWTRKVINRDLFGGKEVVDCINPDPVFTLNIEEEEWKSFGQESKKYYVMTLPLHWTAGRKTGVIRKIWFKLFKRLVNKAGYQLVELPLPEGVSGMDFDFTLPYPIDPVQWFLWIRNAKAFIGLRFHAIVSSFANGTPFFSLDSYASGGTEKSKIHNVLQGTGFERYRTDELTSIAPRKLFCMMEAVNGEDVKRECGKKRAVFENNMNRMISVVQGRSRKVETLKDSCTGCFACSNVCPVHAIDMPENEEGFYFPRVDYQKCVNCGLCDKSCPVLSPGVKTQMRKAYYGYSLDDNVRKTSSSGGVFSLLSFATTDRGGVVYGASFNYKPILRLECHSTREVSLDELKRSKYVQSYIGEAFTQIKYDLEKGIKVLFCGTPCQVDGLVSFLKKDYSNLITVDFVCHGVPSAHMLREHLKMLNMKNVKLINFRPKNKSWVDDLVIEYGKGQKYTNYWRNDEYFWLFQSYRSIRRSCYNCRYCNGNRASDITLADFWGYKAYNPSIYDSRGVSLVLVNTERGMKCIEELMVSGRCLLEEIDTKYAAYAYARKREGNQNGYDLDARNEFFATIKDKGYEAALKKKDWFILKRNKNMFVYNMRNRIKKLLGR